MRSRASVLWHSYTPSLLYFRAHAISHSRDLKNNSFQFQAISSSCGDLRLHIQRFVITVSQHIALRSVLFATLIQLLATTKSQTGCCSCKSLFKDNRAILVIRRVFKIQSEYFCMIATFVLSEISTLWSQEVVIQHWGVHVKHGTSIT